MKHVAIFMYNLEFGGGTERMAVSVANALQGKGYKISIISVCNFDKPYFELNEGIKTYYIFDNEKLIKDIITGSRFERLRSYALLTYRLNKIIKKNKIDILINSGVEYNQWSLPIKFWNKKTKMISWEHFNATHQWHFLLRGRMMAKKYADALVVLTQQDKELYLKESPSKGPIYVINNFLNHFPEKSSSLESRNVLIVGRLVPEKGLKNLVDIWQKVKKNNISNGWKLQIVGDGYYKADLQAIISEKKLENSINLVGATHNVEQYYSDASIYVMTSEYEGFGLVLVEAESFGVPVVSFNCPTGPREIINEGQDGFLIPMGDNDAMAEKILLLMSDEALRKGMGKKAKENSLRFKEEDIIEKWVEVLNTLN